MAIVVDTELDAAASKLSVTSSEDRRVSSEAYWCLLPNRVDYEPSDGPVHWSEFGVLMHNARAGRGHVPAMSKLLEGTPIPNSKKREAGKAEDIFEALRQRRYPDRPTRLRCHYLFLAEEHAEAAAERWGWRQRTLVRCHVVQPATVHRADVRLYERCAQGVFEEALAEHYWSGWYPGKFPEEYVECLVDGDLYFPDWATFAPITAASLVTWQVIDRTP